MGLADVLRALALTFGGPVRSNAADWSWPPSSLRGRPQPRVLGWPGVRCAPCRLLPAGMPAAAVQAEGRWAPARTDRSPELSILCQLHLD